MELKAFHAGENLRRKTMRSGLRDQCAEVNFPTDYKLVERDERGAFSVFEEISVTTPLKVKTYIAEDDAERLLGYVTGAMVDDDIRFGAYGVISHFFVLDQSLLSSVGKSLVSIVEGWFRGRGCGYIRIDSWMDGERVVEVFEDLSRGAAVYAVKGIWNTRK